MPCDEHINNAASEARWAISAAAWAGLCRLFHNRHWRCFCHEVCGCWHTLSWLLGLWFCNCWACDSLGICIECCNWFWLSLWGRCSCLIGSTKLSLHIIWQGVDNLLPSSTVADGSVCASVI